MLTGEWKESQPWQDKLQPGDFVVVEMPLSGMIDATGNTQLFDTSKWPKVYCRIDREAHAPGFVWVTAYSSGETRGEAGVQCILDFTRQITKEEFEKAVTEMGATIKPAPDRDPSDMSDRELFLKTFDELEQLKKNGVVFELSLQPEDAMGLVAAIQLALRHPDFDGPTADVARAFVKELQERVEYEKKPHLVELIRRGNLPEHDE